MQNLPPAKGPSGATGLTCSIIFQHKVRNYINLPGISPRGFKNRRGQGGQSSTQIPRSVTFLFPDIQEPLLSPPRISLPWLSRPSAVSIQRGMEDTLSSGPARNPGSLLPLSNRNKTRPSRENQRRAGEGKAQAESRIIRLIGSTRVPTNKEGHQLTKRSKSTVSTQVGSWSQSRFSHSRSLPFNISKTVYK